MSRSAYLILCAACWGWFSSVGARADSSLALLPAAGDRRPAAAVVDRLEAALLQQKDLALVERQQIEKILAEQQMTAATMVDPKQRVRLGLVVPADLLVFLDSILRRSAS